MIASGFIGAHAYEVQRLDENSIVALQVLQQEVVSALPDKSILQPLDEGELRNILSGHGILIGVFVAEKLVAFRALLEPEIDDEHLGRDIGLAEAELDKVLYQEISNVHPEFRGYGLQKIMAAIIMQQVDVAKHSIICSTVMPYNIPSLKDKFSQHMYVAALKLKYGGKLRYVFAKSLVEEAAFHSEPVTVLMSDTVAQQQLLKEGYVGVMMTPLANDWVVDYRKLSNK